MPSNQQTLLHLPFRAAVLAVLAGSLVSVTQAQEKDPKTGQPVVAPAGPTREPKTTKSAVQPTSHDGKSPAAANPKAGAQPPKGKDGTPAKSPAATPHPAATTPPAATTTPVEGDGTLTPLVHNFPPPPEGVFRFEAFAEPVDVKLLVDMVADRLKVQIISTDKALQDKKIQLYTPIDVPEDKLLEFLGLLLEQNGQYIRKDALGFYVIDVNPGGAMLAGTEFSTTQVIPTRGIKPSSLGFALVQVLRGGPGTTNQQGQQMQMSGGTQGPPNVAYMDDLGVLVMTDTPRRIAAVRELIKELSDEQINLKFTRFEVRNLSATIAKQRMLEMLGQAQRSGLSQYGGVNVQEAQLNQNPAVAALGGGLTSSNLATRLIPDPQSNALSLRGRPEEVELIRRLLEVIDVPNQLTPKWYGVGPAAQALAEQGRRSGLGEMTVMQATRSTLGNAQNPNGGGQYFPDENGFPNYNGGRFGNQNTQTASGPVFVLDADQRGFIYYGTPEQHVQLEKLVKEFGEITQAERVVYEFYKLKFVDAEKTSDLIRGMINNSIPGGESPLIPGAGGQSGGTRRGNRGLQNQAISASPGAGSELGEIVGTEDVFILPDKSNNQVVVKAPQRLQPQFARLIQKIDLRRPQVYIDAKIIVVNNREDFQLAVETQFLNAGDTTNVVRTLFPGSPTTIGTPANILTPPVVTPATGVVAAIIKSDRVPLVINALAQSRAGRVVASPQLLVDDNEEATITSINEEPTTTTTVGVNGNPTTQSFNEYVEAGPKLTVKPRLSTGDLLSLKYDVELSNFTDAGADGVPPPKVTNKLKSDSVTLPSDSTIVVGGLELSQKTSTVFKVPFLGDIPIIGEAFKSTNTVDDKRTVYVFITPRIMRDPIGADLRYYSKGPAARADNDSQLTPVKLSLIEVNGNNVTTTPIPTTTQPDPALQPGLGEDNPTRPPAEPGPMPGQERPASPTPPTEPQH